MRPVLLLVAFLAGAPGAAAAQLAAQQPEKILIVPLPVTGGADSAASIRVVDVARERLERLARYKAMVIPKEKICEALSASGFACDGLMDNQQARQLARFLDADAYLTGVVLREGGSLAAQLRMVDVGGSGFAYSFTARDANPGNPEALGEMIAQRLNTIVRAGERARECQQHRLRGQFSRAIDAARKAWETAPHLPAAHLCVATVYEAQRQPPDSIIAAARRALRGDSLNTHAWETIARQHQVKGDSAQAIDAFEMLLKGDPVNKPIRLGLAATLQLRKEHERAARLLREGLQYAPGDREMQDRLFQICVEGGLWRCVLDGVSQRVGQDSSLLADTSTLKIAIGAAQQLSDTQALDVYTTRAVRHFPRDLSFLKARASAHELAGGVDSAVAVVRRVLAIDSTDVAAALLAAKIVTEHAVFDTTGAGGDSVVLNRRRAEVA
ncbi:MAG: tetratricopeptide repeat protein, partial [Gemmatimonadales bacterium]